MDAIRIIDNCFLFDGLYTRDMARRLYCRFLRRLYNKFYRSEAKVMNVTKRTLALILALILCFGILAGCSEEKPATTTAPTKGSVAPGTTTGEDAPAYPNFNGATLTMYMPDNADMNEEGCYADTMIENLLNMDWNIYAIGTTNWTESYGPLIADKQIPDLTCRNNYTNQEVEYGDDGVYINIYEYLDKMPNVKAFLEDPQYADYVKQYTVRDGVMYCLPLEREVDTNIWTYLYRSDLFEKNKLTWPTNQNEFDNTLAKIKELDPKSYPLIFRPQNWDNFGLMFWGFTWGATWSAGQNAKFTLDANGNYYFGLTSQPMKEMAQYLYDLRQKDLLHPSYLTVDTAGWTEALVSGTSWITYDKVSKIAEIMSAGTADPNFMMMAGAPFAMGSQGVATTSFAGKTTPVSWAIGNTKNLDMTLEFVNWMYSEEAIFLTNWGIEGETYTKEANGELKLIDSFISKYNRLSDSGLNQHFFSAHTRMDAYSAATAEYIGKSMEIGLPFKYKAPEQIALTYTEDEQTIYDTYMTAAYTYAIGEYTKFLLGQRNFSDWDQLEKELKDGYNLDALLKIHQDAYKRAIG